MPNAYYAVLLQFKQYHKEKRVGKSVISQLLLQRLTVILTRVRRSAQVNEEGNYNGYLL